MPSPKRMTRNALAALASTAVDLSGNDPPKEFRIFKAGVIETTKGPFVFDAEAAASVMDAYERHGVDLVIDYDHHSLSTSQGVKAVAAGWFGLEMRDGDLWAANVRWNPPAIEHFAKGEYRYFSPAFDYARDSLRITNLINNALTNTPAMDGIEALIAASATTEDSMDPELKKALDRITALEATVSEKDRQIIALQGQTATAALSAVVGLAATAGDTEVRSAVTGLASFRRQVLTVLEKADDASAIGALAALKQQAGEAAALSAKIIEVEMTAKAGDFKSYLDELSVKGKDGKFLEPEPRKVVENLAVNIVGGGKLTDAGIAAGKAAALSMLSGRTAGQHTALAGGLGLSAETERMLRLQGADPVKFAEFEQKRLAAGGR